MGYKINNDVTRNASHSISHNIDLIFLLVLNRTKFDFLPPLFVLVKFFMSVTYSSAKFVAMLLAISKFAAAE